MALLKASTTAHPTLFGSVLGRPSSKLGFTGTSIGSREGLLAVGFAFDVNAGTKPDAPLWMQRCGMGWVFRLCSEPRRLLGRYAYYNTMFLWLLLKNGWKGMLWGASKQG